MKYFLTDTYFPLLSFLYAFEWSQRNSNKFPPRIWWWLPLQRRALITHKRKKNPSTYCWSSSSRKSRSATVTESTLFPLLDPLWPTGTVSLWLFEMLRGTTRCVSGHVRPNARLLARGSGSIHVFKGHYKSDKPDGVIPREEAEVRHYAMETSISGGIVATIRFSLFPYLPHTAWVSAADV